MPKASPLQGNFSGGELGPLHYGEVTSAPYKIALATCKNYIPVGGLTRRPGTYFVAETKYSNKKSILVDFEFSVTQAYAIEVGDGYMRFFRDNAPVTSGGLPYEIVSPYLEADLPKLKFTQSADVLYIAHPDYAPRKLTRTAHTNWTLTIIDFIDGPYLPLNSTTTTLVSSGAGPGIVTITASSTTGINNNTGFASTDVGRLIRMKSAGNWAKLKITAFTSTTQVTANVIVANAPTVANTDWRLGVWSGTTGYPTCVVFHEDRLFWGGARNTPQRLDGSMSGDYENYSPSLLDGTVADNHAVSYSLNSNDVHVMRWLLSDEKGLLGGTVGGEWVIRPSSQQEALTPTNVNAKQPTNYGSADVQPIQAGKSVIFLKRSTKRLQEFSYNYTVDGFDGLDLNDFAEHITGRGITQLFFQKEPFPLGWGIREDGALVCMSFVNRVEGIKVGWHRHILGGVSLNGTAIAKVESGISIPSPTANREEPWLIVQRTINGSTKRYVEYMTKFFEDTDDQEDAFFVDCGLTYNSPLTVTGITKANPAVVTSTAHGLSNGQQVRLSDVEGMTEVNGDTYTVAGVTANTFQLSGINSTSFGTYISGGFARKLVSSIGNLTHLEGQTVSVLTDGAVHPDRVVTAGSISLQISAAIVQVGLGYESDGQLLRFEAGSADGTALGKTRRTHRVGILLHRSLGLKIGMSFDDLEQITFRTSSDPMTRAPALFSGIISETVDADYDFENQICWRQDQPLPSTILAVMPQMVTQDR